MGVNYTPEKITVKVLIVEWVRLGSRWKYS